jgi:anti-anti-sigma regulatory factor
MGEFTIQVSREGYGTLVSVAGTLEAESLPRMNAAFSEVLEKQREGVILNLYECEYIDPDGVGRLARFAHELQDQARSFEIYVRPMSFVSHRLKGLPVAAEAPSHLAMAGEQRLAERRHARLERWHREKPLPASYPLPASAPRPDIPPPSTPGGEDFIPIDFRKVANLCGKDERVVRHIWETYRKFLVEGEFEPAPDGLAETQIGMDSKRVARELRLDPKVVLAVIESVSTHLIEVFGGEE